MIWAHIMQWAFMDPINRWWAIYKTTLCFCATRNILPRHYVLYWGACSWLL